jgi:2-oxoacid:acceptor oxidoreductase delta subunit (pyruvate/2-ketoisovalerate family)
MRKDDEFQIQRPTAKRIQSQQPIVLEKLDDYPYKSVAMGSTRSNLTGLWRYWRPYYQTKRAPCDAHCPVGNHVVDFIQTLIDGHWEKAANILRGENPLPAITGRICHRPCEINCNRHQYDERIAIHSIETVLAEFKSEALNFPPAKQPRAVAVVGSGPAELSFAHFMASLHHQVTIFEAEEVLASSLRHGPRARHLAAGVLDAEIERIVSGRIKVRYNQKLDRDVTLKELERDYDAIFGVVEMPEHLSLIIPNKGTENESQAKFLDPLLAEDAQKEPIKIPLRVSEAIGYAKWAALLLDSEWRGLNPQDTLSHIQVGGNNRIVSAMKYLALLKSHAIQRSEQVVSYDMLHLEFLDQPTPSAEPSLVDQAHSLLTTSFVSRDDIQYVIQEAGRCFSCGRCNNCDNCWIYCPDAAIAREKGHYQIDYDYCKGCTLCAAVCPRGVISIIEEEKWSE